MKGPVGRVQVNESLTIDCIEFNLLRIQVIKNSSYRELTACVNSNIHQQPWDVLHVVQDLKRQKINQQKISFHKVLD